MAELRGLNTEFENVELYAVSVDPAERIREMIENIEKDGKAKVDFRMLSDVGGQTVNAYGLYDPAYSEQDFDGIPHPAVYVLDKDRKVVWAKVESDYRKRPSLEEIRNAIGLVLK